MIRATMQHTSPSSTPLRSTEANHYLDDFLMIGRLTLTPAGLEFKTHIQNFKQYNLFLTLSEIKSVSYKNNLGIFSHGIWIHSTDGVVHHFSVWSRRKWKEAIEQAIQ